MELKMKICKKCTIEKESDDFYKGHATCKKCYIEKVKNHQLENYEHYREYDKNRANLPHRIEARIKYQQTEAGKEALRNAKEKWQSSNVIKRAANNILTNAVRDGKITKSTNCSECGKEGRIHGHHDDYAYPLIVRWLCPKCHSIWHKTNKPLNG